MNPSNQPPIQAVLFDWDMTLGAALGEISSEERTVELLRQANLNYSAEIITLARDQRQKYIAQGQLPGPLAPQTKDGLLMYYQQLLELLGHPEPSLHLSEQIYTTYAHLPFVLYPDTLPALRSLAQQKVRLGIITNHSPEIRPVIEERLGEFILPQHITISGELNLYKPGRAIFLAASVGLGMPAEQCLYVGDNLEVDAIGAVQSGGYARGLWCDRSKHTAPATLPPSVYRITNLTQTLNWL